MPGVRTPARRPGVLPSATAPARPARDVNEQGNEKNTVQSLAKGFRVLPKQVRVIQGDGVDYHSIGTIYEALTKHGISAENLVLGMGGAALLRQLGVGPEALERPVLGGVAGHHMTRR